MTTSATLIETGRTRLRWLGLAVPAAAAALLVALVGAGGVPEPVTNGLPDAGLITAWALPIIRLAFDIAAVATIGSLVTVVLMSSPGDLPAPAQRALRVACWASWTWAATAGGLILFMVSDVFAVPANRLLSATTLSYIWQLPQTRALLVVAAVAVVLASYCRWVRRPGGAVGLLVTALAGLTPALLYGHADSSPDHDLAVLSLLVHVLGASLWVGGLIGMLVFLRNSPQLLAATVPRYSTLALVCFACVAGSGLLNAWIRASGDLTFFVGSGYGALLLAKVAAVLALGIVGYRHRKATLPALEAGRPRAFLRLASGEGVLMAATVGVAVALSRTPAPVSATAPAPPNHGGGHATVAPDLAPYMMSRLLTEWRPDAISLTLVGLGLAAYAAGWLTLRRRGQVWPWKRSAAAVLAGCVAVLATSGGLAAYSTAMFSAQVAQFMVMFIVVPVLACLSAPVSLLLEVVAEPQARNQPEPWPRRALESPAGTWLSDPFNAMGLAVAVLFGLYATPLLEASLRSVALHLGVNLIVLLVGLVFWWSVLAVDPAARPRARDQRLLVLVGFLGLLLLLGARIYFSPTLIAGSWFQSLDWAWLEVGVDQRRGAGLWWAGITVLGPLLYLSLANPPVWPRDSADPTRR